jgi:suppressor for copper-sensitivity B
LQNNVYDGDVVLPVSVSVARPSEPIRLRASIRYAACAEVCVPYHAELALDLPTVTTLETGPESAAIAAARRRVPGDLAAASLRLISATLDAAASPPLLAVTVRSDGPPFAAPDMFVEGAGSDSPAAPQVEMRENGRVVRLLVRLPSQGAEIAGKPIKLTLVDGSRAAEFAVIPMQIAARPTAPRQ